MKTRTISTTTSITAIGAVALMALTGCAGGETAPSGNGAPATEQEAPTSDAVFDFSHRNAIDPGPSISFEIPEELLAVATDYAETRFLDTVTVTGLETQSSKFCAARIEFGYADGSATAELISDTDWFNGKPPHEVLGEKRNFVETLGLHFASLKFGDPDLANLDGKGLWISDDRMSAVQIAGCASSPHDPGAELVTFAFNYHSEPIWADADYELVGNNLLAAAALSVMKNGNVTLVESEVEGFVLDSNGSWIED